MRQQKVRAQLLQFFLIQRVERAVRLKPFRNPAIDGGGGKPLAVDFAGGNPRPVVGLLGIIALVRDREKLVHQPQGADDFRSRGQQGNGADHGYLTVGPRRVQLGFQAKSCWWSGRRGRRRCG